MVGDAFLRSLTQHLGEALGAALCFVSELVEGQADRARVLASWPPEANLPAGSEYELDRTPCQYIVMQDVVSFPEGTVARFPDDTVIASEHLDGYLAVAIKDAGAATTGYVGIGLRGRFEPTPDEVAAIKIFAARAGAEVHRRRQEATLRERDVEVVEARIRVVAAADEERRRIGRDLHDGVQQRIVALTQRLDLARRRLADPLHADELLAEARELAATTGIELRELARGLHPAGLSERGLEGALALLGRRSAVPLRVLELPERRLPDAVETTVYYVVSEALSNAGKYAGASEVCVRVLQDHRLLRVEVSDDGSGGASAGAGSGLDGLADRIGALGGVLEIDSPPGRGTRLLAEIPLAPWRDAREPFLEMGHEGDDGLGEQLIAAVTEGRKTATVGIAREWDLEGGPPRIGQRLKVMDHRGNQRCTVEVTRVTVVPFCAIDEEAVAAETAGGATVEEWRERHWRFYESCRDEIAVLIGEPGWRLTNDEPMVITHFRVLG